MLAKNIQPQISIEVNSRFTQQRQGFFILNSSNSEHCLAIFCFQQEQRGGLAPRRLPPSSYGPGARVEGFKEKRRVEEVEGRGEVEKVAGGRRLGRVV